MQKERGGQSPKRWGGGGHIGGPFLKRGKTNQIGLKNRGQNGVGPTRPLFAGQGKTLFEGVGRWKGKIRQTRCKGGRGGNCPQEAKMSWETESKNGKNIEINQTTEGGGKKGYGASNAGVVPDKIAVRT